MKANSQNRWTWGMLLLANGLVWGVLAFREPSASAQQKATEPFGNSVEQRQEMIAQLKELNAQMKEQNTLLKSGKLEVVVAK